MSAIRRRVFIENNGAIAIQQVQDVSDILKVNELTLNSHTSGSKLWNKNGWVKVASIPLVVLDQWHERGIKFTDEDDWKKVRSMLNSNEFSKFRTAPGSL